MYHIVTCSHESSYSDPIQFSQGDRLELGRRDDEYPGWIWVTTPSGNQGWAPESLIRRDTETDGVALDEYTARELDTSEGERVFCTREVAGWLWVEDRQGRSGWIPKKITRVEEDGQ